MAHIILTAEQTQAIASSLEPVEVRDVQGRVLVVIKPVWTKDDIEDIKRRMADPNQKRYTTAEVLAHLKSLEAI
jgi:hypothetical protein